MLARRLEGWRHRDIMVRDGAFGSLSALPAGLLTMRIDTFEWSHLPWNTAGRFSINACTASR
jgi:hypothetical protein